MSVSECCMIRHYTLFFLMVQCARACSPRVGGRCSTDVGASQRAADPVRVHSLARRSDRGDLPPLPHSQLGADPAGPLGVQMLATNQKYHQQGIYSPLLHSKSTEYRHSE